jgi:hypothetical protein
MAERGDGLYRQGEKSENVANEANFDENVINTQDQDPVAVAANSGVDSGLDKREEAKPQFSNPEPKISNPRSQGSGLSDRVAGGTSGKKLAQRESRRWRRREMEKRELERRLRRGEEAVKACGVQVGAVVGDIPTSSPAAAEILEPHLPRSP